MARISSFTVFVWVTLFSFSILSGLFIAYASSGVPTVSGVPMPSSLIPTGPTYLYSNVHNITLSGGAVTYAAFDPDKRAWFDPWGFSVQRFYSPIGIGGFWLYENLYYWSNNSRADSGATYSISQAKVSSEWDPVTKSSRFRIDIGTYAAADMYIQPLQDSVGNLIYGGSEATSEAINWSMAPANGTVTISMGGNATNYNSFDFGSFIGSVAGVITFSAFPGAPSFVVYIIGGIWWMLLLLGIGKLILG